MLVAGEGAELVDARLDVVTGLFLALTDGFKVDLVLDLLVGGERRGGDIEAEVALGLHDGDPIFTLEDHAATGGPDGLHRRGGVAIGEDIRDVIGFHRFERGLYHAERFTASARRNIARTEDSSSPRLEASKQSAQASWRSTSSARV